MHNITLKPKRAKPVRQRHPWLFSGAIAEIPSALANGDIVDVTDASGGWLARGYLNRQSQIQVRLLTWDRDEAVDEAFWHSRLAASIARRAQLPSLANTNAYRLVHAESDGLPGLVVDRCGDWLAVQVGTLAIDQRKTLLAELLRELTVCAGVVERSELALRGREGLSEATGVLVGDAPPAPLEILENGLHFDVDLLGGQKTGFYTDQRRNRQRVAAYCRANQAGENRGARVLDAFAYSGAFGVNALEAGAAHVTFVDASVEALELGEQNLRRNGFDPETQSESWVGDVFEVLRDWHETGPPSGEPFDVIVLDPPKFAQSRGGVERALRGYKEINRLALGLLRRGGVLATFSCSGLVGADLFQKVLFGAALDANRDVQIIERLTQGGDYPVALTFPEGEYLKGLICRVE